MCKFCAMSGLSNNNYFSWNHFTFIDFVFKRLSHKMESKVRTQSPSRPCCCLNIPESKVNKRLGLLRKKNIYIFFPTDFPLYWKKKNAQVALQVFEAWRSGVARDDDTNLVFGSRARRGLKCSRCVPSQTYTHKCAKVLESHVLSVYWPRRSTMLQLK